jgi:pyrophosphatase PpaX
VRFDSLLFDFDGTLVDSIDLILQSFHHTVRVHRLPQVTDAEWLETLGTPLRVAFRRFTSDPAEIERMIATYREWNYAHHDAMVKPFPGAVEAVHAAKAKGAKLGIVTSKNLRGLLRGLSLCGFDGAFDAFVTADSMEQSKPNPAPVLAALSQLGSPKGRALLVGDSPHDIAAGKSAGIKTAACLWGPFSKRRLEEEGPDYWLASFRELIPLVG